MRFSISVFLNLCDSQLVFFSIKAIWGRHPMLYFKIPRTKKCSKAMCYFCLLGQGHWKSIELLIHKAWTDLHNSLWPRSTERPLLLLLPAFAYRPSCARSLPTYHIWTQVVHLMISSTFSEGSLRMHWFNRPLFQVNIFDIDLWGMNLILDPSEDTY